MTVKEIKDSRQEASKGPRPSFSASIPNMTTRRKTTGSAAVNKTKVPSFESVPISHSLLLLSDSALPLGSFAYSSGLESYIAHNKPLPSHITPTTSFNQFLSLSLASIASTTIPYLHRAHRHPEELERLDNDLDASTPCTVARRASVAQGLALLQVWERALKPSAIQRIQESQHDSHHHIVQAVEVLDQFSESLKCVGVDEEHDEVNGAVNGHFAPLWAVVCLALDIDLEQAAYVFMLNHAKAVLSAAVRASVMGPYQSQGVLAGNALQKTIAELLQKEWWTEPEDAGQVVPVMDLWMGRHELLYSRIFNS
ncbi:urease accessory protein UreF [Nannizzia gypsea CBS 118893]|uniref:Urease accessory protein UreF n=1 Tax=Arthroderma gypseum (strain ATCC MYA-4604 / CBS 118893) TaxID=535722 RepID=E4UZD3_ARTGP|nr:urease accessory protein UreF [Nannizzia gypsea CBS 118893]EFR03463.1 urease accessory protein UreF [Nannizzia gypsea CBS 118893]